MQLYWNPKTQILTNRWRGFCSYDEIQAVGTRILDAVVFEKSKKILYDAKQIEVLDEQSQLYISGVFTREMIDAGIKYAATVLPMDIFAKFSVDDIQKKLDRNKGIYVSYFNSFSQATDWLRTR